MKHLHSWSVFMEFGELPGTGDIAGRLEAAGLDGFELFTLAEPVPPQFISPAVVSVHLPYAVDWRSAWEGRSYEGVTGDVTYLSFGHDREEMIDTVHRMIGYASVVDPAYGVLHAGNTDMRQVLKRSHDTDDMMVLSEFAEMVNSAVSRFPGGEPPYKLALENLWWEGLKLRSPAEWRFLEDKLEFENWGFVLDTGHLMNICDGSYDEESAIEEVLDVVSRYPSSMMDRICTMHLQLSTTAGFRDTIVDDYRGEDESWDDFMARSYVHVGTVDQHRPFSSKSVRKIVDAVQPEYLTHEVFGGISGNRFADVFQQRALFD